MTGRDQSAGGEGAGGGGWGDSPTVATLWTTSSGKKTMVWISVVHGLCLAMDLGDVL